MKKRIVTETRRFRRPGEVHDKLDDLAIVRTADCLEQLVSHYGGREFKGYGPRFWYEPHMGKAPDPPFDDPPVGPPVTLEEASLAWPVLGIPVPPRTISTLEAFKCAEAVTYSAAAMLRPGAYPRMELVDSEWRRFRIIEVEAIRRRPLPGLSIMVAKLLNNRLHMSCTVEPLPPTSKEAVRKRLLAMLDDDPAGWTWSLERKHQRRERARIMQGADLWAMAGGISALS